MRRRSLQLHFSCDEDWESFRGDAKQRHCDRCAKQVHDLAALTRSEATELFRRPPRGGLCVRYVHDGKGRVLFRSERYPGSMAWKRFVPPAPSETDADAE